MEYVRFAWCVRLVELCGCGLLLAKAGLAGITRLATIAPTTTSLRIIPRFLRFVLDVTNVGNVRFGPAPGCGSKINMDHPRMCPFCTTVSGLSGSGGQARFRLLGPDGVGLDPHRTFDRSGRLV